MRHVGDFAAASTVRIGFNTCQSDGTPITLAGTPTAAVYKDGSTTESTTGVTLTVDFDARTGSHLVVIDTSADGTFYASGSDFRVVLTAGTVNGVSVVGSIIAGFSINNRSALRPATAGRTLNVDASGRALADLDTIKTQAITCAAAVTVLASVGTASTSTAQSGDSYARIGAGGAGLTAVGDTRLANLDAAVSSRLPTSSYASAPSANSVASAVWADLIGVSVKASVDKIPASPAAVGSTMQIDLTQVVPPRDVTSKSTMDVGDCLAGSRAEAAGAESVVSTAYTKKNPDGSNYRSFTLDSATSPTTRS